MPWLALLLTALSALPAVEATVVAARVVDGDTLAVAPSEALPAGAKRSPGGDVYVRLLCIDTFEVYRHAAAGDGGWEATATAATPATAEGAAGRDLLAGLVHRGDSLVLADEGTAFTTDRYGRVLAFVRRQGDDRTLQERQVEAGWTAYWQRWRRAPAPLHDRLREAEAAARAARAGAWATRGDEMARKSAEQPRR